LAEPPTDPPAFLLDECVNQKAFGQLVAGGLDVEHVGLLRQDGHDLDDDAKVLEYAVRTQRIVITSNFRDFAPLAKALVEAGRSFPGILFIPISLSGRDVGGHVAAVQSWTAAHMAGEVSVENTYLWLSTP